MRPDDLRIFFIYFYFLNNDSNIKDTMDGLQQDSNSDCRMKKVSVLTTNPLPEQHLILHLYLQLSTWPLTNCVEHLQMSHTCVYLSENDSSLVIFHRKQCSKRFHIQVKWLELVYFFTPEMLY